MPGKGRRIASRQSQLGSKRKKNRGPSGIPDAPPPQESISASLSTKPSGTPVGKPAPTPTHHREPRLTVHNYIGAETKRILRLGGVIIAILVALTFILN